MRSWRTRVPPVLVLFLVLAAGCLDAGEPGEDPPAAIAFDPDWSRLALADGNDHDHEDRLDHLTSTTPNFEVVGYDPMISPYHGTTPAGYACGDVEDTTDGRRLAVVESRTDVGFAIADVTDPFAPVWLGELVMPTTRVYDLAVVPDGRHVVLVMSGTRDTLPSVPTTADDLPELRVAADQEHGNVFDGAEWHHRCNDGPVPLRWDVSSEEDPVPRPLSILLVDIQDPSAPTIVDQKPLTGYGHSVDSTLIDGRLWVVASNVGNPNQMSWQFFEVLDSPLGDGLLSPLGVYTSPLPATADDVDGNPIGGHTDGWVQVHPETGDTLAFLVGGWHFIILDMTEPHNPVEMGYWTDRAPGRAPPYGNLHSAFVMPDLYDGRHYTVIGPEFAGKGDSWVQPTGTVWVLDTTDPANVVEVGAWTLPHDVEWRGTFQYSNHYLTVLGDTVFVSMYHGGVWALDLSVVAPGEFTLLPSIGVFMPTNESPAPPEETFRWAPNLQEVLAFPDSRSETLPNGVLVTFDSMSGLYVFVFDESSRAPSPEPWPVVPVPP